MSRERFTERQADVRGCAARLAEAVAQPESERMKALAVRDRDLAVLRRTFRRFLCVREVRLFGSRATGTARRASDIDLAISAPDASAARWLALTAALDEAPIIHEFDVVRTERAHNPRLMERIVRDGVSIYPEEPTA